ncbi:MAG: hypothetical protein WAK93_14480 [Solirubrobacteraceae bacterium]
MSTSLARRAAAVSFGLRIAFGVGLLAAPSKLTEPWLGSEAASAPAQVPLRALGTREIVINGLAMAAWVADAPLRPWLVGGLAGDLTDVVATLAGRRQLPDRSASLILAVGGAAALANGAIAVAVES